MGGYIIARWFFAGCGVSAPRQQVLVERTLAPHGFLLFCVAVSVSNGQ
jgi:hypothetical protein